MKIIIGNIYQPVLDGSSVRITRAMSDPVPTCTLSLMDNTSSIQLQAMQELLILDDQVTPNPAANMLQNPSLNPYNGGGWTFGGVSGGSGSQNPGGGLIATMTNAPTGVSNAVLMQQTPFNSITPGQTYTLSYYAQGSSIVNIQVLSQIWWLSPTGTTIVQQGPSPLNTSNTRYTLSGVAPTGAYAVEIHIGFFATSTTNSGTIVYTQVQFEPNWFPALSYPTPWVGPSQPRCQQLPSGLWIRQYRKFAGFVTRSINSDYHGNARTVTVNAVGYAWLLGTILSNKSYTSQLDSAIIADLLTTYLPGMLTTTNVVSGVNATNLQSNWDDARSLSNNLCTLSGFYWTVSYYWDFVYAPPGYFAMPISLICDNSSIPDMVTTFPAYDFSFETDYTQPGSSILVMGSGSNVAKIIDASTTEQIGAVAGYTFAPGTFFQRKITDSTLNSVVDCTQRGMAELYQYDYPRSLAHLTANVELLAGESIAVTSKTDGLNQTSMLLQQVTAQWLGTDETLADVWEYQADLGAVNRAATSIMSRLFRLSQQTSSAPAISTTTLAVLENVGIVDGIDSNSLYAQTVLADSPVAYYRLGEPSGFSITTAYDWSGSAFNGTYVGGFTLGETGAIYNDTNTSVLFDGSTGWINLVTGVNGNGLAAISVEMWCKLSTASLGSFSNLTFSGTSAAHTGYQMYWSGTSSLNFVIGNGTTTSQASYAIAASSVVGTWLHIVGTYDGTNVRLYVNGVLRATTPLAGTISASAVPVVAADTTHAHPYPGTIDEVAIYSTALSQSRVAAHYNVGTAGHA